MTKPATAFAMGERITHSSYGTGTIREISQAYTVIDFDDNGRRKFLTSMVQLEPTDVPAPPPPARKARSKAAKPTK